MSPCDLSEENGPCKQYDGFLECFALVFSIPFIANAQLDIIYFFLSSEGLGTDDFFFIYHVVYQTYTLRF